MAGGEKIPNNNRRIRRTPAEARRLILEAAEADMARSGPAGLRLEAVAKAAGVSHPTVLHHFGSREGLIRAVSLKTVHELKATLLRVMDTTPATGPAAVGATFAAYRDGLAQRMIWLLQSQGGSVVPMSEGGLPTFDELVEALHGVRQRIAGPDAQLDIADTRWVVHLTTVAAFGDALLGPRLRRAPDAAAETAQRERFENWFGDLLALYMSRRN
jgi:AcrR family transcriptional regulator